MQIFEYTTQNYSELHYKLSKTWTFELCNEPKGIDELGQTPQIFFMSKKEDRCKRKTSHKEMGKWRTCRAEHSKPSF
jgi:hypothetical protein